MKEKIVNEVRQLFTFRWQPGKDILVVIISWVLVVGALYTATVIVGSEKGGGIPYFLLYGVLAALVFGVGIPVGWMVFYRKKPLSDLGITKKNLFLSIILQIAFTAIIIPGGLSGLTFPGWKQSIPLFGLALAIGFFEALFWRGWVLMRLEESFGFIPAALIGSALYAAYHIGYSMPLSEMIFLFFIGLMYAVVFRITRNIFILWPVFQPSGQLITLLKVGLTLPIMATIGFVEVLAVMIILVAVSNKLYKKILNKQSEQISIT